MTAKKPHRRKPGSVATKLTQREEAFALYVVQGLSQAEAYRKAYNSHTTRAKTVYVQASIIAARPLVQSRIAELRKPAADASSMTLISFLASLEEIRVAAFKDKQYSAATRCVELQGKALGLLSESMRFPQFPDLSKMSDDELLVARKKAGLA